MLHLSKIELVFGAYLLVYLMWRSHCCWWGKWDCCCCSLRAGQSWGSLVAISNGIFLPVLWLICLSSNFIGCWHSLHDILIFTLIHLHIVIEESIW